MSAPKKIEPSKLAPIFENIVNSDSNNRFCADCHSKNPRWASTNLGVFLCIKCAGIHRHIGTHITKVKSTTLDCWEERQILTMKRVGNTLAATVWESTLPSGYPRPTEQSEGMALESFIRAKYEHRKWFNKEAYEAVYNGKGAVPRPKASPAAAAAPAPKPAPPAQNTTFFDFDAPAPSANSRKPSVTSTQPSASTNFFDFGTPATTAAAAPAPKVQPPQQKPQPQQQSAVNLLSFDEPPRAQPQSGAMAAGSSNANIMALFGAQPQYQAQQPQMSPFLGQQPQQQPQANVNLYAQGSGNSGANYSVDLSAYGIYRSTPQQQQQQTQMQQQQQYYMQQQQQQQYYMQQQQQMYGYNPAYSRNGF